MLISNEVAFATLMAFILSLAITRWLIHIAPIIGLLDHPAKRKIHDAAVPVVGGVAMFVAASAALMLIAHQDTSYRWVFLGAALLVLLGTLDDLHNLTPVKKLLGQMFAAILITSGAGIQVTSLGDLFGLGNIYLGTWAFPFTVICIVGVVNALNMTDGLDGLAGTLSLISLALFALVAVENNNTSELNIIVIVCAAITGFLFFNIRHAWQKKAQAFMGDAGSMTLGFVLSWFAIRFTQSADAVIPPSLALWFLALPLIDMGAIISRRIIKGLNPFMGDREHLHHILLVAGFTHGQASVILSLFSLILSIVAIILWITGVPESIIFYLFVIMFLLYTFAVLRAWRLMRLIKRVFI